MTGPTHMEGATKQKAPRFSLRAVIRDTYFAIDRRTLGFTRLMLGFLLLTDLFRRTPDWNAMFSTEGVLPNDLHLFRPQSDGFSIVSAFSTRPELAALWVVVFITFCCVFVGYRTRFFQILALLFVTGMNGRVLLIENGGYVVYNLLLLWTAFLPLGDRFSVDAMRRSFARKHETTARDLNDRKGLLSEAHERKHVSLVVLVILLQLASIYYFNVVHKTGSLWRNGTAVHYVMYVDRMVTPLIGQVRDYIPWFGYLALTRTVIAGEAAMPLCLLTPLFRVWARRAGLVIINFLHIGFGSTFVLGPFAWALCVFSTLLIQREDWELFIRTMRRPSRRRTVFFDPSSPLSLLCARFVVRLDNFELLRFREHVGLETVLAVGPRGAKEPPADPRAAWTRGALDILAALPMGPPLARVASLFGLRHLVGLGASIDRERWERFWGLSNANAPRPVEVVEEPSPLSRAGRWSVIGLRELLVIVMWVGAINQAAVELWAIRNRWKVEQPEATRVLAHKMRFLQGWFMFSPQPVTTDGTIVVDAITIDGRHVDPFTGEEPNFDLLGAKSFGYNQIWSDYFNRIALPANRPFRDAMTGYMRRLPERTGNPNDALVRGDVYWVKDVNPVFGQTFSTRFERDHLFSFGPPPSALAPPVPSPLGRTEP